MRSGSDMYVESSSRGAKLGAEIGGGVLFFFILDYTALGSVSLWQSTLEYIPVANWCIPVLSRVWMPDVSCLLYRITQFGVDTRTRVFLLSFLMAVNLARWSACW